MGSVRTYEASPVSDLRCELGEGPRWDGERGEFCWVDILHGTFRRASWDGARLSVLAEHVLDAPVGAVTTVAGGGWLAAAGTGFVAIAPSGEVREIAATPPAATQVRVNDAQCDAAGRFWAGTMPYDTSDTGAGALYRLDPDLSVHTALPHATIANGLAWTPDGSRMWWVDSGDETVWTFRVADDGTLHDRGVFYQHSGDGVPDGICRDEEGQLWVAINGGGEVRRFDASGRQTAVVRVPDAHQVSSCCLGGPSLTTLFCTTTFEHLPPEKRDPNAGLVHAVEVDVPGRPMTPFAGTL
jgi:sugar lactone lactonase YvrE